MTRHRLGIWETARIYAYAYAVGLWTVIVLCTYAVVSTRLARRYLIRTLATVRREERIATKERNAANASLFWANERARQEAHEPLGLD